MAAITIMRERNITTSLTGRDNFLLFRGIIVGSILSAVKYQNISTLLSKCRKIRNTFSWQSQQMGIKEIHAPGEHDNISYLINEIVSGQ